MEIIVYLILFAVAIYLIYLLIVYVILPIISFFAIATLTISVGFALVVSLMSFVKSVKSNLDPYATYVDKHSEISDGSKRNYCFGPGFHQIYEIVKGAFWNLSEYRKKLTAWKDRAVQHKWFIDIWIYFGYVFAVFCAQALGFIWVTVFSVILAIVIMIGMVFFFLFFSTLWLIDRLVLLCKSIHNRCPRCKRKSVIPIFICPTCGIEHKKLAPGPYGVVKRKCSCGAMLSTTFLAGRSEYEAHCPFCGDELLSSQSQQYGIQLVGGVGTGKTTFLAAFWHEYKEQLDVKEGVAYKTLPTDAFDELEYWFNSGKAEATIETNASMYSIILSRGTGTSVQMTIYDIAGEAFDFAGCDTQQQQYRYCEGFVLVIDPTVSPEYVSETATNFINSLNEVKGVHSSKALDVPVAIIITKSDIYKKEIGLPGVRAAYKNIEAEGSQISFEQYQNEVCRTFLSNLGFGNVLNLIEAEFANIRFFPVSSMGHNIEDGQYEPWGVLEPIYWLMRSENCPLKNIVQ